MTQLETPPYNSPRLWSMNEAIVRMLVRLQCSGSDEGLKVYLHRDPVDFRVGISSTSGEITIEHGSVLDIKKYSPNLEGFIFCTDSLKDQRKAG